MHTLIFNSISVQFVICLLSFHETQGPIKKDIRAFLNNTIKAQLIWKLFALKIINFLQQFFFGLVNANHVGSFVSTFLIMYFLHRCPCPNELTINVSTNQSKYSFFN